MHADDEVISLHADSEQKAASSQAEPLHLDFHKRVFEEHVF